MSTIVACMHGFQDILGIVLAIAVALHVADPVSLGMTWRWYSWVLRVKRNDRTRRWMLWSRLAMLAMAPALPCWPGWTCHSRACREEGNKRRETETHDFALQWIPIDRMRVRERDVYTKTEREQKRPARGGGGHILPLFEQKKSPVLVSQPADDRHKSRPLTPPGTWIKKRPLTVIEQFFRDREGRAGFSMVWRDSIIAPASMWQGCSWELTSIELYSTSCLSEDAKIRWSPATGVGWNLTLWSSPRLGTTTAR